ncbi:uncharacterized protein BYT42DRAFT_349228 [Radiomyces spectabilis]|uniref:uncharacterized protein n=1 Tax=Radiomyces spectabilis TaxID=64574 RepID=UPI00221E6785|nr:uncharacterized protein BYT42DRAFT_349228 [Radiomyces spectabilis]KAI8377574.1 hypothetical protein BYT42DRAFT_349228 [Radiomyces spectabilis]
MDKPDFKYLPTQHPISNEEALAEAEVSNRIAGQYAEERQHGSARSFEDLELEPPNSKDRVDPENSSWVDAPKNQVEICKSLQHSFYCTQKLKPTALNVVAAPDNILPKLKDETPMKAVEKSNEWIAQHMDTDDSTSDKTSNKQQSSPYKQLPDGTSELVG